MSEDWIESARESISGALGVSVDEFAAISREDARARLLERQAEKQQGYDTAQGRVNKRAASRALKAIDEVVEISEKWFAYDAIDGALNEVLELLEAGKHARAKMSLSVQKAAAEAFGGSIWTRFQALETELSGPTPEELQAKADAERAEREAEEKRLAEEAEARRLAEEQRAAEQAAQEAEARRQRELEEQIRAETEERLKREAEAAREQQEAEERASREAAERARLEAEMRERIEREMAERFLREQAAAAPVEPEVEPCDQFSFSLSPMARLHVLASDGAVESITFGRYRSQHNPDLPLMNAVPKDKEETMQVIRMISGRHGSLRRKAGEWFLIDAWNAGDKPSTNGIYLDGEQTVSVRLKNCSGKLITFSSPELKPGLPAFKVVFLHDKKSGMASSILLQRMDTFRDHILILGGDVELPSDLGGLHVERVGSGFKVNGSDVVVRGGINVAAFDTFAPLPFEEVFYQRGG